MKKVKLTPSGIQAIFYLSFFLLTWLGIYFTAGYLFFFQEKSSFFQTTTGYFQEQISRPGGWLNYLGQFQTALYFYPLVGSLIVASEIILAGFLSGEIIQFNRHCRSLILPFLFIAFLCYFQLDYRYMGFNTLGILLQVLVFYLTVKYLKKSLSWLIPILPLLMYYFTGFFSVIFLGMVLIRLILSRENHWMWKILLTLVVTATGFFTGRAFLFYSTDAALLLFPFSLPHTGGQGYFFVSFMVLISFLPLYALLSPRFGQVKPVRTALTWAPVPVFFLLLGVLFLQSDHRNADYFRVEKLFYEQKYDQVVQYNLENPSHNQLTQFLNNIALCETGKLNDLLFSFPQSADGGTLFLKWEMVTEVLKRGGYWYYSLGLINEAQRWAYENMVMQGYTPEGLKMLIKTELINGNYGVASKYIYALKNSLFYRKEAMAFERLLRNEQAINAHPEYGRKRKQKPVSDFFVLTDNPPANLAQLIKSDSTNQAAIAYHFAWLLLQKNIPEVVKNLPLLEKAGYSRLPLHLDEAATGFKLVKMGEFSPLQKLDISAPVIQRFDHFYRLLRQNNSSREQAQQALLKEFGRSFWFYYFFQ